MTDEKQHDHKIQVDVAVPEEVTLTIEEQKILANRMIAHLKQFEDEKELVNEELEQLAKWKKQEEGKLKTVIRALMMFVAFWALGGAITGFYIWGVVQVNEGNIARNDAQTAEIARLNEQNAALIRQVETLNRVQASEAYDECVARNTQTKQSRKELAKLTKGHRLDGSMNAAKFWKSYLDKVNARKLPTCMKPDNYIEKKDREEKKE